MSLTQQPQTAARKQFAAGSIGFMPFLIAGAAVGYLSAPAKAPPKSVVRTVEKPATDARKIEQLRKQLSVVTAQKNHAEAKLAESQKRLAGCRRMIQRYQEELKYVNDQLKALKGGAK